MGEKTFNNQSGSAILWILLAVALFAALNYAFNSGSRTSTSFISQVETDALASQNLDYTNTVRSAVKRLKLRGCAQNEISYETPDGQGVNNNSPSDKSCHVFDTRGGQVIWDGVGLGCDDYFDDLYTGFVCDNAVYIGEFNGNHLITTLSESGGSTTYGPEILTGANSSDDGLFNTNILIGLGGHPAAEICRALGPDWYLPSRNEFYFLWSNKENANIQSSFIEPFRYISSTETSALSKLTWMVGTESWLANLSHGSKTQFGGARCLRRISPP